ncbi:MAG: hypothetical protein ACLQBD_02315 [Syntrophobacteraceae bacterium]
MGKLLNHMTLKIREGAYDERLEELFNATLNFAVLVFFAACLIMFQLGCFECCSQVLKPAPGIVWPVFPN